MDSTSAHRAESAWLIFGAVLILSGLFGSARPDVKDSRVPNAANGWLALAGIAISLVLYSRILSIGLLSDDFVTLQRVREGHLVDTTWGFVRPLPLAIWWIIDRSLPETIVSAVFHVLNAVLHGVNGWLVFVIAKRLGLSGGGRRPLRRCFSLGHSTSKPLRGRPASSMSW